MKEGEIKRVRFLSDRFFKSLEAEHYSLKTVKSYRIHLNHFLRFLSQDPDAVDLPSLTGEIMNRYQMHIHQEKRKNSSLSVFTHHARLTAVKRFFRFLAQKQKILSDPSGGLTLPRKPRMLPRVILSVKEMERVLKAADVDTPLGLRNRAVLEVLYSTGIRNAELRGLNLSDMDAQNGEIRVNLGKGGKDRVLPLGEVAAHYVGIYIRQARPVLARGRAPSAALFLNRYGGRLQEEGLIYNIVGKCVKKAGLKKNVTPHTFRHTCATHMLRRRAGVRHIQALLGHASLETTQRYTHVAISDLKREHRRCHPREQKA